MNRACLLLAVLPSFAIAAPAIAAETVTYDAEGRLAIIAHTDSTELTADPIAQHI